MRNRRHGIAVTLELTAGVILFPRLVIKTGKGAH